MRKYIRININAFIFWILNGDPTIYYGWKMREMKSFLLSLLLLTPFQNEKNKFESTIIKKKKKRKKEIYFKNLFQKNIHCNIREIRCSIDSNKLIHAINFVYITWKIHVSAWIPIENNQRYIDDARINNGRRY